MFQRYWLSLFAGSCLALSYQLQADSLSLHDAIAQTLQSNPEILAEQRETGSGSLGWLFADR